eukprot:354121-Prymnesium_polylepis.2
MDMQGRPGSARERKARANLGAGGSSPARAKVPGTYFVLFVCSCRLSRVVLASWDVVCLLTRHRPQVRRVTHTHVV